MRRSLLLLPALILTLFALIFSSHFAIAQETATPSETPVFEPLPEAYTVDWSSDGAFIAVGTADGVFVYDMVDKSLPPIQMLEGLQVTSVVFHPTEPTWLAVNPRDEESLVAIIDLESGESVFETNTIVEHYTDLGFTANGERLIVVAGGVPVVYHVAGIEQPYVLYAPEPSGFSVFAVSPNGEQITAAQGSGIFIDYFDAAEEQITRFAEVEIDADLTAIGFSPESDVVIVGDERGSLRKWSLPDLTYTSFIRGERSPNSNRVNALEFATEQPIFYSAEGDPVPTVRVFQLQGLYAVDAFGFDGTTASDVLDLALNPDETQIAALLDDNTVFVINLEDKSQVARLALRRS